MNYAEKVGKILHSVFYEHSAQRELYVRNPDADFTDKEKAIFDSLKR